MLSMKLRKTLDWKTSNIYLLLAIIIGAILRFYKLGAQSFWLDEILSITQARLEYYDPVHPPLSFLILRIFLETLGTSEFVARLPACLFGIATVPLIYVFGEHLFGEKEGIVASFIIALSPWYIRWSQETRMYTQLTVFTILALYFFCLATYKNTITFYVLSAIFMTLAFYTHYSAVFILGIIVFWLNTKRFFERKRSEINSKHLLIFFGVLCISCVPLFFTHIPHAIAIKLGGEDPRWGAPSIGYFIFKLFSNEIGPLLSLFSILGAVLIVLKRNNAGILLILYAGIPLLTFSLLISWMNVSLHYLLFTLPAYALLSSYLIVEIVEKIKESDLDKELHVKVIKSVQINTLLSIEVMLVILLGIHNLPYLYYYYSYGEHPDWKAACSFVESQLDPEDVVVSTRIETVEYYLGRVDYKLSEENFVEIKNSQRRVWLLIDEWRIDAIDPDHVIRDWLTFNCTLMFQDRLIEVYLFRL